MSWFWTDDLARLLIERDPVTASSVSGRLDEWSRRPEAYAAPVGSDAIEVALTILGVDTTVSGAA